MEQQTNQMLFSLLRSVFHNTKPDKEIPSVTPEIFSGLLSVSKKHDIEHLLIHALELNGLIPEEYSGITSKVFEAAYRCEQLCFEFDRLCTALEEAKIPFIPLKGSVIRKYYPEPWMRTSCDIDILVHEEDLEKSVSILIDKCEYDFYKKGSHDAALITPGKIRVELHYSLIENEVSESSSSVLSRVWESADICEGFRYQYKMSEEMFYFYHIAHMAKHIENGGCGIKPFADLWVIYGIDSGILQKSETLLAEGNLLTFARTAQKLSKVWFANEEADSISQEMEDFILNGGSFGSAKNRIAVQQQKNGGKTGYLFTKIFLPYNEIKFIYPVLQKHRWLTPAMEIFRWFRLLFGNRSESIKKEIRLNQSVSEEESDNTKKFLLSIGLLNDN